MALEGPCEFSRSNLFRKMRRGVERGAERKVHERDTQSCGELFLGAVSVNPGTVGTGDLQGLQTVTKT